tara:strand:+ start:196 stop:426 length:231 start_codon:yes stop_codon:yes gene_type:complete
MIINKKNKKRRTTSDMISTVCFIGVGVVLVIKAKEFYDLSKNLQSIGLVLCSIACFLGGMRFLISDFVNNFREKNE